MKEIIIKESNKEKIMEAIKAAEKRSYTRLMKFDTLVYWCKRIERETMITKVALTGTRARIGSDGGYYKYNGKSYSQYEKAVTQCEVLYKNNKWYLTSVKRSAALIDTVKVDFSESAKKAIVENFTTF